MSEHDVARQLRKLPVPEHGPEFWNQLDAQLVEAEPADRADVLEPPKPRRAGSISRRWWLITSAAAAAVVLIIVLAVLPRGGQQRIIVDTPSTVAPPVSSVAPDSVPPTTTEPVSTPTTTPSGAAAAAPSPSTTTSVVPTGALPVPAGAPADPDWLFTWQGEFLAGVRGPGRARYVDAFLSDGVEEWRRQRIELPEEVGILNSGIIVSDRLVLTSSSIDDNGRLRQVIASTIDLETWEIDEIVTAPGAVDRGVNRGVSWIAITEWGWAAEIEFEADPPESWVASWDGEPRRVGAPPEFSTPPFSLGDRLIRQAGGQTEISSDGIDWSPIDLPFRLSTRNSHDGGGTISMPNAEHSVLIVSNRAIAISNDGTWQEMEIPVLPADWTSLAPGVFESFNPTSATIINSPGVDGGWAPFLLATNGTDWLVEPLPEDVAFGTAAANGSFAMATNGDDWLMFEFA